MDIVTMNVQGLQNDRKRKELFMYVKKLKYDVVFMQETHSEKEVEKIWKAEYGGTMILSHGDNRSRGAAILFRTNLQCKIEKVSCHENGRYVIVDCEIANQKLTLVNIYAPNSDDPDLMVEILTKIGEHNGANIVIGGDLNLVLDENKDAHGRKGNNRKAASVLKMYMEEAMLVDYWREMNPNKFEFTWHRKRPKPIYARLDYFLINYGLVANVEYIKNIPAYKTDHSAVKLRLKVSEGKKRGPGLWKLNASLLHKLENIETLKDEIQTVSDKAEIEKYNACCKWEKIKECVVKKCMEMSKNQAKKNNCEVIKLQKCLEKLQEEKECATEQEFNAIENKISDVNSSLRVLLTRKAEGARIRSKSKWYSKGEMSNKYYLGLEKVKYANKTLNAIMCDDNTVTREEKKILREQRKFYKKLYTENPDVIFNFVNESGIQHSEEEKGDLEAPFTFEEFTQSLRGLARGKTPGNDGLTMDFYIIMWKQVGKPLWEAVLESHKEGKLYLSARRGVISLIPKKNRDPLYIKNYRPISLLNNDHKLVAKMITNRLKKYIHKVIRPQQTGYVPGRYIGINLRKMIDLLGYLERENTQAILLALDFEKCFDSIAHKSLMSAMRYFNVGEYLISWIEMLYKDFELCVINNGKWSTYFKQMRGVHQGSPLSGPVFLYVAEILAHKVIENKKIKGIKIGDNIEEKITQYADDTNMWSTHNEESVNAIIDELEIFYKNTGLKVNYEKSVIYRIGAKGDRGRLYLKKKFKWGTNVIDTLGLLVNLEDLNNLESLNYDKILEKANGIINAWNNRSTTLIGKIEVANSLINSLFVYIMQVLPTISVEMERKIRTLLSKFVWNAKKPKIRHEWLCLKTEEGGRKLANMLVRDKSLKISWVKRLIEDDDVILK